ncbi:MAG: response regulator transcription factor [Anaerolineae bacterium]|nr:response regulator transcription factor [Anaerolineae bacterium]MCB9105370.1 response regulator transcription factor [Anaerolineales bacterium]
MDSAKILIIDDELAIRLTLAEMLMNDGYEVVTAKDGQTALEIINREFFDLALIDINLGDMSGTEILSVMRAQALDTVAIILTAHASLNTAIDALRHGAYDYLFKPCQPNELRNVIKKGLRKRQLDLRQQNLLRQVEQDLLSTLTEIRATVADRPTADSPAVFDLSGTHPAAPKLPVVKAENMLHKGGLTIHFDRHSVTLNAHPLELSPTEFDLLAYLVTNSPRVISAQELVAAVQGYETAQPEASGLIRTHIYHIRQKIKQAAGQPDLIRTIRNIGYQIE